MDGETPIRVVDPSDTSDSPRIILNSVVTKVERGGTPQDPWVKVTAGTELSDLSRTFWKKITNQETVSSLITLIINGAIGQKI